MIKPIHNNYFNQVRQGVASCRDEAVPMRPVINCARWGLLLAALGWLDGCVARAPLDTLADNPAYVIRAQQALFNHLVIEHLPDPDSGVLHIYIEGDGTPWLDEHTVAADPTPRTPLALTLMALDRANSIYLGRPCYFADRLARRDGRCDYHYWTDARYASAVIDSMMQLAQRYIEQIDKARTRSVAIIGYSGGAVLATMMADRCDKPVTLVTLGGNLNVAAWTSAHHYSPLTASVDPFVAFEPRATITHYHLVGADDDVVSPAITASFTDKFQLPLTVLPHIDHRCCWRQVWAGFLQQLEADKPPPP